MAKEYYVMEIPAHLYETFTGLLESFLNEFILSFGMDDLTSEEIELLEYLDAYIRKERNEGQETNQERIGNSE